MIEHLDQAEMISFLLEARLVRLPSTVQGWIVECSFDWIGKQRHLRKDYDQSPLVSEV